MFDFKSTQTIDSKVCHGVRFTIRKPTQGRRAELHLAIAESVSKYDAAVNEYQKFRVETPGDDGKIVVTWEPKDQAQKVLIQATAIDNFELTPKYLKWGLVSIEGLEIDGQPATVETLLSDGPEELIPEIRAAIEAVLGLSVEQQKNSQPPSTSQKQEGGNSKPSIVDTAKTSDYGAVAPATEGAPVSAI